YLLIRKTESSRDQTYATQPREDKRKNFFTSAEMVSGRLRISSYFFSQTRSSNTSERHCERSRFTAITQYTEIQVENWKYSSTEHPYHCRGIRVGTSGYTDTPAGRQDRRQGDLDSKR